MKKFAFMLFALLSLGVPMCGQNTDEMQTESAKPLADREVVRWVSVMDIEGVYYNDVVVTLKSITPDLLFSAKSKVKVKIEDVNGKVIWKKTLKGVFLYEFSTGQVQVGKVNFDQIVISRSSSTGEYVGILREKDGV